MQTGKTIHTDVACVECWSRPYFLSIGTISIPPPIPKRPFIIPANRAKTGYNFFLKKTPQAYILGNIATAKVCLIKRNPHSIKLKGRALLSHSH